MITCSNCSQHNEAGATFCDQCGSQLGSPPPVSSPPTTAGNSCPQCSAAVIPGEIFCDNCGSQLGDGNTTITPPPANIPSMPMAPPPPNIPPPPIPAPSQVAPPIPPTAPNPPPGATAQLAASNGETFSLSGKTSYVLGRVDEVSGIYPDVDTSSSGGEDGGVSRRHAQISYQGGQWSIEDFNSTNGTQVNNQRLMGGGRQSLNPGDQIRLGTWQAKFG